MLITPRRSCWRGAGGAECVSVGNITVARKGVDIPADQFGDASFTYKAFDSGATLGSGFHVSADGGKSWRLERELP